MSIDCQEADCSSLVVVLLCWCRDRQRLKILLPHILITFLFETAATSAGLGQCQEEIRKKFDPSDPVIELDEDKDRESVTGVDLWRRFQ